MLAKIKTYDGLVYGYLKTDIFVISMVFGHVEIDIKYRYFAFDAPPLCLVIKTVVCIKWLTYARNVSLLRGMSEVSARRKVVCKNRKVRSKILY